MPVRVCGATPEHLDEVHAVMQEAFGGEHEVDALKPFYAAEEKCDPEFRPEHIRFRRQRGRVASVVKVYVRKLHHPAGSIPVAIIGCVCTRQSMRGRGLVGLVIKDSIDYARSIGAQAVMIVTPRKDYYLRHGFKYFNTCNVAGRIPEESPVSGRVEPLLSNDARWMTEMYNAAADGYGPIVRSEEYTRKWVLERGLARLHMHGFKLIQRNHPVAYGIFMLYNAKLRLVEVVSRASNGADQAALLSFWRNLGQKRFIASMPARHPLVRFLRSTGQRLRTTRVEQYMHFSLAPEFPIPDESFDFSHMDFV